MTIKTLGCVLVGLSLTLVASHASGALLTLTTIGSSGTLNGALFTQYVPQSTGSGVISSFLRIQANGTEQGYNTDGTLEFDSKGGGFTHSVTVGAIPVVSIAGVSYWEIGLDINQNGNNLLSLDKLQVFVESTGNLSGYPSALTHKAYDLGDNAVLMNASLSAGSGSGDVLVYVPVGSFGGDPNKYLYVYSSFGALAASNDGVEEWFHASSPLLPEPATVSLLVLGGLVSLFRRRRAA